MRADEYKPACRFGTTIPILLCIGLLATQLGGCASPAYYWQAASGHLSLMHARQSVDDAIAADTDADVVETLKLSRQIKAFAVNELQLPDNGSYDTFVRTGRDAVVWNVIATPEFSLQAKKWCFPVAGCVPYRGYFEQAGAERFAQKLRNKGLDAAISPATAYSTLGWFDDPLLDTMWRQSEAQFAAYLFHELAHQVLYVRNDARFNESYASFVEKIGVERWLSQRGEKQTLDRWHALADARTSFDALVRQTRGELAKLYASGLDPSAMRAGKTATLDRMESRYRGLRDEQWQGHDYFGGWFEPRPNNARFALVDTYQGGNCAFANLYARAGGDMARFQDLAQARSRLPAEERRDWLDAACRDTDITPDIAPAEEL